MKISLKLITIFFGILFSNAGVCQQDTVRFTKIKLENGAKIKGYLLKDINTENLILKTPSGNAFYIELDDIKKIKFGRYGIINESKASLQPIAINRIYDQRIGTYSIFGLGLNFSEYNSHVSLTSEFGKRFNKTFSLGVAVNYDRDHMVSNLPIYLNGRAYLNNSKISPFLYLGTGYSLAWANDNFWGIEYNKTRGGLMGQLGIGYQLNFSGSAMLFNVGYKVQSIYQDYNTNTFNPEPWSSFAPTTTNINVKENRLLRRAEVKISFLF